MTKTKTINRKLLLFNLADTFSRTLGIELCEETQNFMKVYQKKFVKLNSDEKLYYSNYGLTLAKSLSDYFEKISLLELNTDEESDVNHDFKLHYYKNNVAFVSMSHYEINTKNIIPEKLMKICQYKKNTNVCKEFLSGYKKICVGAYKKIKTKKKYSKIDAKVKSSMLLTPICKLVVDTIGKKRKHAKDLYKYIFAEDDRVVLKLYKNRFRIYDFGIEYNKVESYRMKLLENDIIQVTFNNGANFAMKLKTNSSDIKEHISLKFQNTFKNMDLMYGVGGSTV